MNFKIILQIVLQGSAWMRMNNEQGVRIVVDSYALFLFLDCLPLGLCKMCQWRTLFVVFDDVVIEDVVIRAMKFHLLNT